MDTLTDEQLMQLIGEKSEEAFSHLLSRHKNLVYGTIFRLLGPYSAEAEDLAQEVFIKVWKAASNYRPEAQFTTWLLTICRNSVFTQLKKSQRRKTETLEIHGQEGEGESPHPDLTMLTPAANFLQAELNQRLEVAIARLPLNQREAIIYRQQEQLDYEEIAKIMGVSVSSVKSLLFRARDTLRENLKDYLN